MTVIAHPVGERVPKEHDSLTFMETKFIGGRLFLTITYYNERNQKKENISHELILSIELRIYYYITTDEDRKSTRLNSSHVKISYDVFCLKKKIKKEITNKEKA